MLEPMMAWLWLGAALVALPAVLAVSWAIQRGFAGRYLACLAVALACGTGLAALFALLGERATYDPHASGVLGNWSGLAGALVGLAVGWVTGTVAGPAVLLRLRGIRLDAARLIVAILVGAAITVFLIYLLEVFRAGDHPLAHTTRLLAGLSSAATFAGLTLASRDETGQARAATHRS